MNINTNNYTMYKQCNSNHKELFSSGKKMFSDYNGLTTLKKKKVDCWSTKNVKMPCHVSFSNGKKFWFDCDKCGHEFESSLNNIAKGKWCPYCANKKLCNNISCKDCFEKTFASFDGTVGGKKKVDCWSDRNPLKPYEVCKSSSKMFWFDCDNCGHDFESALNHITRDNGTWCPYCANKKLCNNISCKDCFEKCFACVNSLTPSGTKILDCWSDRNHLKPYEVCKCSGKKFWFDCDNCGHNFETALHHITKGVWCPYCANHCKKLCSEDILCYHCYNNSFASVNSLTPSGNLKTDCWSDRNDLNPREVCKSINKKFWFDCDRCCHEFDSVLHHITNGGWCPYCCASGPVCGNISCKDCFEKSFASFDGATSSGKKKVDCWAVRNEFKPYEFCKSSHKKCWFDCDNCCHQFESYLSDITNGRWCPYCANKKRCNNISCKDCFEKSFANFEGTTPSGTKILDCWSDRNPLKPYEVCKCSGKKFWFDCDKCCNKFESAISKITNGTWCPNCHNKTELKLYNWLLEKDYINSVKREWCPKWCSTEYTHFVKTKYKIGRHQYRFDFLVTLKNKKQIIIELDGRQHYEQVRDWKTPIEQQIRDKYKEFKAKGKGLSIIRCYQADVYMDRNNWKIKLENLLQ